MLSEQKNNLPMYNIMEQEVQLTVKHNMNIPVAEPHPDHFFLHGEALS